MPSFQQSLLCWSKHAETLHIHTSHVKCESYIKEKLVICFALSSFIKYSLGLHCFPIMCVHLSSYTVCHCPTHSLWRTEWIIEKRSRFLWHVDGWSCGWTLLPLPCVFVCVCAHTRWRTQSYWGTASQGQNRGRERFQDVGQSYTNKDTMTMELTVLHMLLKHLCNEPCMCRDGYNQESNYSANKLLKPKTQMRVLFLSILNTSFTE